MFRTNALALLFLLALASTAVHSAQSSDSSVAVSIITDESDAVLALLSKKLTNRAITQEDQLRLFSSEGYVRLKNREASLHRDFTDEEFKGGSLAVWSPLLIERIRK